MGDPERWEILFYRDDEGNEPVREWLEELEKKKPAEYGRVRHHIDLIGIRRPAIGTVQQAVEREVERAASRRVASHLLRRPDPQIDSLDELQEEENTAEGDSSRGEADERLAQENGGTQMTTWKEHKGKGPLRGAAKKAYEAERRAMGIGYLILKARAHARLSQEQLARKIGTSQPMVARWESGAQVPSVRSLMRIAEATGFELAIGIKHPGAGVKTFELLEVLERSGSGAEGRVLTEATGQ